MNFIFLIVISLSVLKLLSIINILKLSTSCNTEGLFWKTPNYPPVERGVILKLLIHSFFFFFHSVVSHPFIVLSTLDSSDARKGGMYDCSIPLQQGGELSVSSP